MNLGFIILAHNQPDAIRRLVEILATDGNRVVIHFDTSASLTDKQVVQQLAAEHSDRVQVISKVHCVWGEWSLVEAVLLALGEFEKMPQAPDYIHLMSGADLPVRPIADLKEFLQRNPDRDFIECCDITRRPWVKGGLGRERLQFYFPVNFRTRRQLFDRLVRWHRKLKIRRRMPLDLTPHMGSQWWTLRWSTCAGVLDFIRSHPRVVKFFRSTWIPDESFFQTVIAKIIPRQQVADLQLMFHHLSPTGRPYVFYNDHASVVRKLPHFFIRKVSPEASQLFEIPFEPPRAGRPIPKPKHLLRVRDLLRSQIDRNHLLEGEIPGYIPLLIKDAPPRLVVENRPLVLFLLNDGRVIDDLERVVRAHPRFFWLGRPFAPGSLEMPPDALERTGVTERSWKLRDHFIREFLHRLVAAAPDASIPVAVMLVREDEAHLASTGLVRELVPFITSGTPLMPHQIALMAGTLHTASPALAARIVHIEMAEISTVLDAIASDPRW